MARLKAKCKGVTDGETRGTAERYGETMVEVAVEASRKRETAVGYDVTTGVKTRMYEDGSGLVEIRRSDTVLSIRLSPEVPETPSAIELFASFDGVEGVLVPTEETPR